MLPPPDLGRVLGGDVPARVGALEQRRGAAGWGEPAGACVFDGVAQVGERRRRASEGLALVVVHGPKYRKVDPTEFVVLFFFRLLSSDLVVLGYSGTEL